MLSAIKLESQDNNSHTITKQSISTTLNTTIKKRGKSLRRNTLKTLSILDINLTHELGKNKFIFVHIPKCAGNSMWSRHYKLFRHELRKKNFKYFKDSPERNISRFSFSFVRNPWDRLISAYKYLANGGNNPRDLKDYESLFSRYKNFRNTILNWDESFFNQIHFKPQWNDMMTIKI